jgi:hypothetical protein
MDASLLSSIFQPVTTTIVGFILLVVNSLVGLTLAVLVVVRMGELFIIIQTNFRSADARHQFKAGVPSGINANRTSLKSRRNPRPEVILFIITKPWIQGRNLIHAFYDSFFFFFSLSLQGHKHWKGNVWGI